MPRTQLKYAFFGFSMGFKGAKVDLKWLKSTTFSKEIQLS